MEPLYNAEVQAAALEHGVDPNLIHLMIRNESQANPQAVSRSGAQGLMQMMPATSRAMGVDNPMDPGQNIRGGTKYMKTLIKQFGGDLKLALAAYNAGPTKVRRLGRVPRNPETVGYVDRILSQLNSINEINEKGLP